MSVEPVVVLVHGAFAESASWNGVIRRLRDHRVDVLAVANPLRDLAEDATYVRDVVADLGRPVVLAGHGYGGMVISEAAAWNPDVRALVYVAGFAPEPGESVLQLAAKFPGSKLDKALLLSPLATGGGECRIAEAEYHRQYCADLSAEVAELMMVTQRPVTEQALKEGLTVSEPGWLVTPSWFVYGERDLALPSRTSRFMARRARARGIRELVGASHAVAVSQPGDVTATILEAAQYVRDAHARRAATL
ncbi:alpha/beta hydrolase [Streptomyces sp. NPDC013178]|uniref:alpha/beta fold hydrolase n=1 Tax=Streptomyces sp. NPDC013178 TaxID=3155118 RepID=UPI00340E6FEE